MTSTPMGVPPSGAEFALAVRQYAPGIARALRYLGVPDAQTLQPLIQLVLGAVQGPLQWRGHALELRCRHGAACWSEAQGRLDDLRALTDRRLRAAPAAQRDGPWVNPLPTPPRPPSTRSRASDQG